MIKHLAYFSRTDLLLICKRDHHKTADDDTYCEACSVLSALDAGIPPSVIAGKTKLSDHFSPEYIKSQLPDS